MKAKKVIIEYSSLTPFLSVKYGELSWLLLDTNAAFMIGCFSLESQILYWSYNTYQQPVPLKSCAKHLQAC